MNNKIFTEHVKILKNTDRNKEKVVICFSGISGAGKTSISKYLEEKYDAVRISSDDIRKIIFKLGFGKEYPEQHKISKNYLRWLLSNYSLKNKFIVLDNDISKKYDNIFGVLSPKGWKFFIVKIDINPATAMDRVRKREPNFRGLLIDLNERISNYNKFNKEHKAQFVFDNEKESNFDDLTKEINLFLNVS